MAVARFTKGVAVFAGLAFAGAAACNDVVSADTDGGGADGVDGSVPDARGSVPSLDGSANDAAIDVTPDGSTKGPLAFVFAGESNSGGIARNSDATVAELAARPSVRIMNLYSGTFAFEPLDIGFNNIVDHAGLSDNPTYVPHSPNDIVVHGMELGLANAVEAGAFAGVTSVYLIKTGQGGSQIAQWAAGGPFWAKFLERTNAAKATLPSNTRWVVWYSQGINDSNAGVSTATWKVDTTAHLQKIKAQLPGCQIILTEFQSMPGGAGYPAYNAAIRELVAADPALASIPSDNAGNDGAYHWSYAGYRNVVVPALVAKTKQ